MASSPKDILRQQFDAYRRALSTSEHNSRSRRICARTKQHPAVQNAGTLMAYWPHVERGEVDTRPLIGACVAAGMTVALPVVTRFEAGNPAMEARLFSGTDALEANRWGLHEPVHGERILPADLDVIIVPAFGVDQHGHRIGHGSGFYDRFLGDLDCTTIALSFDACMVNDIPTAPHDVPATYVITETTTVTPLSRSRASSSAR